MVSLVDNFDRVAKVLVDERDLSPDDARAILSARPVIVRTGMSVAGSPAEQAALFTLANLTKRVFKRPLHVDSNGRTLCEKPVVPWPASTVAEGLSSLGAVIGDEAGEGEPFNLLIGDIEGDGLRLSHAGWSSRVAPSDWGEHLLGPSDCALAGIACAALALGEVFAQVTGTNSEATHRPVGHSLWRPDLRYDAEEARGPELKYLPGELWLMGLGHLGQGVLWALSLLPFPRPEQVELILQDFERAIPANRGTQALMAARDSGKRKTRICSEFLQLRGFDPAIIDRKFDEHCKRTVNEPGIAIAAFDRGGPRWWLDECDWEQVVVLGVGGTPEDFDEIQLHMLPLPLRKARDIWKPEQDASHAKRLATTNRFYRSVFEQHRCGDLELASVSVAAPFVGALAGSMAMAEVLRVIQGGPQFIFQQTQLRAGELGRYRERCSQERLMPRLSQSHQIVSN